MASTSTSHSATEHPKGGVGPLILNWVALLALTATTFGVSRLPIGNLHLPAAIFIACVKVTLVVLFFVLADIATRFPLSNSRIPPMPQVDQKLVPSGMPPGMPAPTGSHTGEEGHR